MSKSELNSYAHGLTAGSRERLSGLIHHTNDPGAGAYDRHSMVDRLDQALDK